MDKSLRSGVLIDYRVVHYVKAIMDEVFAKENMLNEVIYGYRIQGISRRFWARKHDTLLFYVKDTNQYHFRPLKERVYYEKPFFNPEIDEHGRYYRDVFIRDVWDHDESKPIISGSSEYLGFRPQKSEGLLQRVISASANEGDLVADFFCGSDTTLAVADKLGRHWIGVDLGRYAIHISRKRLIQVQHKLYEKGQPYRSFDVYNLGRYERQWWQLERLQGADAEHRRVVLQFYKATPFGLLEHGSSSPQQSKSPHGSSNPQQSIFPHGSSSPQQSKSPHGSSNPQQSISPHGSSSPQQSTSPLAR